MIFWVIPLQLVHGFDDLNLFAIGLSDGWATIEEKTVLKNMQIIIDYSGVIVIPRAKAMSVWMQILQTNYDTQHFWQTCFEMVSKFPSQPNSNGILNFWSLPIVQSEFLLS